MKTPTARLLAVFSFALAIAPVAFPRTADSPSATPPKAEQPSKAKAIHSYQDVLAVIPAKFTATKPNTWTGPQRDDVNTAFKEALIDRETPAKLRLKVTQIADWGGMTFFSEVPNSEGYHIRVFGKFADGWEQKFAALKRGDTAILKGVLKSVTYRRLWGTFTLSICLKDCTFIKVDSNEGPNIVL